MISILLVGAIVLGVSYGKASRLSVEEKAIVEALAERDTPALIKSLVARMSDDLEKDIDKFPDLIREMEDYTRQCTDSASVALLHSLTAEMYSRYYQNNRWKINQRTSLQDYVPDDIREWSGNLFSAKIKEELAASLRSAEVLQQTPTREFADLFKKGKDSESLRPTLFDFLAYRAIELQPDAAWFEALLAFHRADGNRSALLMAELDYLDFLRNQSAVPLSEVVYSARLDSMATAYAGDPLAVEIAKRQYQLKEQEQYRQPSEALRDSVRGELFRMAKSMLHEYQSSPQSAFFENQLAYLEQPSLSMYHNRNVYPGKTLRLQLQYQNVPEVTVRIYENPAPPEAALRTDQQRKKGREVKTLTYRLRLPNTYTRLDTTVEIPMSQPGLYLCEITDAAKRIDEIAPFSVSRLATSTRRLANGETEVLVADYWSGKPVSGASVAGYNMSMQWIPEGLDTVKSDANGLARFPSKYRKSIETVRAFLPGDTGSLIANAPGYRPKQEKEERESVSFFTDRSLYRPGQHVSFKGIVYVRDVEKPHVVPEREMTVRLVDAQGQDVAKQTFRTNEFGSFSGEFTLPKVTLNGSFRILGGADGVPYCMDEIRVERSVDEGPDWFELRVTVLVGGMRIPFYRFRRHILEGRREFLLPDGRMILLPEEWFSQYANVLDIGTRTGKGIRVRHSQGGAIPELFARLPRGRFPDKSRIAETPVPEGLKATLRPYQRKGFSWMETLRELGFGGCLADDMGLGKTLQTLALLQRVYVSGEETPETEEASAEAKPACPAPETLEMDETGQLNLFPQDGDGDSAPLSDEPREVSRVRAVRKPATLIVAPTSLLHNWRREAKRFTSLSVAEYSATMSVSPQHPERFFGRYNLILTSYGIMRNRIETLRAYRFEYVVLDESQYIKSSDSLTFQAAIQLRCERRLTLTGTPVENSLKDLWAQFRFLQPDLLGEEREFHRKFLAPIRTGNKRMEARLKQLIAPFVLRRSKEEVAPELPPLTEETIFCGMTGEQKEVYEREKNSLRNFLLGGQADKGRPFSVLNGILRLRQLACHPRIVSPEFTGTSDKTEQIVETFATLRSEGHKVLIFSSFVTHLEILAEAFRQRGWEYALLTGSTDDRPAEIARFTERPDVHAFFISLKAGGVGLNLTQADYVFIVDPWWNPAAEAQAIARAHRIGQQKRVIAYRFITRDSIEEKIRSLQEDKRLLADTLVNDDVPALSYDEWVELLG